MYQQGIPTAKACDSPNHLSASLRPEPDTGTLSSPVSTLITVTSPLPTILGAAACNRSTKLVEACFPRPADGDSTDPRLRGDCVVSPLIRSLRGVCGLEGRGDPISPTPIGLDRVITFVECRLRRASNSISRVVGGVEGSL